jgi:photosystem II stability/assembly factor-like uncharacterized protein
MSLNSLRSACMIATLLLVACSERSPATDREDAEGASGEANASNGPAGLQPVPRAQPTESGAWVVDPTDPLTLYALGERSMRSRDGGHTWAELDWPANAQSLAFTEQPVPALYLRVSGASGASSDALLESLDGGDSWANTHATALPSGLVVVDEHDGPVLLGLQDDHVVRSTDKGATWVASVVPPATVIALELGRLIVSRQATPVVYLQAVGPNHEGSSTQYGPLVLVSTDAGATFVAKSLPSADAGALSLDCRGRLYVQDGTTLYRSTDAGASWEDLIELEPETYQFAVTQGIPAVCSDSVYASGYVGQKHTFWQLDDSALTNRGPVGEGELTDMGDDRLLLVSHLGLRQRSDDGGRTWWTAGVNLGTGDLALSPMGGSSLFVSTVAGVYRSDDDGTTWTGESTDLSSRAPDPQDIYPDPQDVNVLYARTVNGGRSPWSFVSTDRGASFQDWPVPTSANPEVPVAIRSTAPGVVTVVTHGGVYVTNDAGGHFTTLLTVPPPQQAMCAAIGNSDPPAIYVYVTGKDRVADEIWASLDGGATWASSPPGAPGAYVTSLVVEPADPQVAFWVPLRVSGEEGAALRTLDGGLTWERVADESEEFVSLHFDPRAPHALYAVGQHLAEDGGWHNVLHSSEDHGDTWHTVTELPAGQRDFELAPNAGGARYVLSESGLLYKMTE